MCPKCYSDNIDSLTPPMYSLDVNDTIEVLHGCRNCGNEFVRVYECCGNVPSTTRFPVIEEC